MASFVFQAPAKFVLSYTTYSNRGSIEVWVDGSLLTTLNANSASLTWQKTYTSPSYSDSDSHIDLNTDRNCNRFPHRDDNADPNGYTHANCYANLYSSFHTYITSDLNTYTDPSRSRHH